MKNFFLITLLLLSFASSFAAFPVKTTTAASTATINTEVPVSLSDFTTAGSYTYKSTFKAKLIARYISNHEDNGRPRSNKNTLSVLSFCFGLSSVITGIMLIAFAAASVAPAAALFFLITLALSGAGFTTGLIALIKKQKLMGLAIAGMTMSLISLLEIGIAVAVSALDAIPGFFEVM